MTSAKSNKAASSRGQSTKVVTASGYALIVAAFLPLIFFFPFHVPVRGPVASQSYEFGFNNAVAQAMIALLLFCVFAWSLVRRRQWTSAVARKVLTPARTQWKPLLIAMAAVQAAACGVIAGWYAYLPYTWFGEFLYFQQRLELMAMRQVPYRDFTFDYGPLLIYPQYWIYRAAGARLSVEQAHLIALLVHTVIGFAMLAFLVSRLQVARWRVLIYVILAVPMINISMGFNYTPLRFMIAPCSLFLVREIFCLRRRGWKIFLASLAGLLLPLIGFGLSPEMGMVISASLLTYFAWHLGGDQKRLALLVVPVIAGMGAAGAVLPAEYYVSIVQFGLGGANFPLFPTIHVVSFLIVAACVIPGVGLLAVRWRTPEAAFCAALNVLLGLLIVPAMGRCDSGHVFFNSFTLFAVFLAMTTWTSRIWQRTAFAGYAVIYLGISQVTLYTGYGESIGEVVETNQKLRTIIYFSDNYQRLRLGSPTPSVHYSKLLPMPRWFDKLPKEAIGLPLGCDEPLWRFLVLARHIEPDFHLYPNGGLFAPSQLTRKFQDLDRMQLIYVSDEMSPTMNFPPIDTLQSIWGEGSRKFMSELLLYPVRRKPVNGIFVANYDILMQIKRDFEIVTKVPTGYLMRRRGTAAPLPSKRNRHRGRRVDRI